MQKDGTLDKSVKVWYSIGVEGIYVILGNTMKLLMTCKIASCWLARKTS